jgi:hypothetical protein
MSPAPNQPQGLTQVFLKGVVDGLRSWAEVIDMETERKEGQKLSYLDVFNYARTACHQANLVVTCYTCRESEEMRSHLLMERATAEKKRPTLVLAASPGYITPVVDQVLRAATPLGPDASSETKPVVWVDHHSSFRGEMDGHAVALKCYEHLKAVQGSQGLLYFLPEKFPVPHPEIEGVASLPHPAPIQLNGGRPAHLGGLPDVSKINGGTLTRMGASVS